MERLDQSQASYAQVAEELRVLFVSYRDEMQRNSEGLTKMTQVLREGFSSQRTRALGSTRNGHYRSDGFVDLRISPSVSGRSDEDSVWPSFTDIMTVVVLIFWCLSS